VNIQEQRRKAMGWHARCNDAPDTSGMNRAAEATAALSKEALDWYKQVRIEDAPARKRLEDKAYEVADQQLQSSRTQDALAKDYDAYNKSTFRPLEQSIVADANAFDTPQRRQAAADEAMADVNKGFAATNSAAARTMAANGLDPGSARAMAVQEGRSVDQAKANAGAAFTARRGVETIGAARKMDAASLGRGLASNQATSASLALTAGNNAVANTGVPVNSNAQANAQMGQGFSTAMQGQQISGNLYGQQAQIQGQDSGLFGALGGVAGAFAGSTSGSAMLAGLSDVNMKTDIKDMSDEEALAANNATPVQKWKYDPAAMAEKGIAMEPGMEGEKIGPMAQDVQKNMGDKAAPGGKKIDLVTMNGVTMKAVQALDKKINRIAEMIGAGALQAGVTA
jgi:hypothetical protein